jgi:hypothetical protein
MSYRSKAKFAAIVLSVGAAQFAFGEDLTVGMRNSATIPDQGVNRTAKTDRGPILAEAAPPMRTIAIHVDRLPSTSVLVRIPRAREAQGRAAPTWLQQALGEHKPTVACEPVVSVLTEIAKRLRPGRCLT